VMAALLMKVRERAALPAPQVVDAEFVDVDSLDPAEETGREE